MSNGDLNLPPRQPHAPLPTAITNAVIRASIRSLQEDNDAMVAALRAAKHGVLTDEELTATLARCKKNRIQRYLLGFDRWVDEAYNSCSVPDNSNPVPDNLNPVQDYSTKVEVDQRAVQGDQMDTF